MKDVTCLTVEGNGVQPELSERYSCFTLIVTVLGTKQTRSSDDGCSSMSFDLIRMCIVSGSCPCHQNGMRFETCCLHASSLSRAVRSLRSMLLPPKSSVSPARKKLPQPYHAHVGWCCHQHVAWAAVTTVDVCSTMACI